MSTQLRPADPEGSGLHPASGRRTRPDDLSTFSLRVLRQARGLSREQAADGAGTLPKRHPVAGPAPVEAPPPPWARTLAEWLGRGVAVSVGMGELIPARLLDGDDVALLLNYAGQAQLVRAGRVNWVSRKTE